MTSMMDCLVEGRGHRPETNMLLKLMQIQPHFRVLTYSTYSSIPKHTESKWKGERSALYVTYIHLYSHPYVRPNESTSSFNAVCHIGTVELVGTVASVVPI